MDKVRIYLADDHVLFRGTIARILVMSDSQYEVREADDGKALLRLFEEAIPDIVIVCLELSVGNGFRTCARIAREYPEVRIIALSMYDDRQEYRKAIDLGAHAFVSKYSEPGQLTQLISDLSTGRYDHSAVSCSGQLGHDKKNHSPECKSDRKVGLTQREFDIVSLLCRELTNKQIAYHFGLSQNTIRNHKARIMHKAGVKSTPGLVRMAYENQFFVCDV